MMPRRFTSGASLLILAALGACSKHDTTATPPPPPPVASVTIAPSSDSVAVGQSVKLTATAKDADGVVISAPIAWTSTDASVATVDSTGLVAGVKAGNAGIKASSGVASASAVIRVTPAPGTGSVDHVFIVVLENRDYDSVIGMSTWPYLNSLVAQGGLATDYRAVTHPSIGNYFEMTVGDTITNDDNFRTVIDVDNAVRRLLAAGKTWTSYAEDLPSVGYIGPDQGRYTQHHNTVTLVSDVANSTAQRQHLQPFTQFSADLASGSLANWVFIVPNSCDDGHDCSDNTVDTWLRTNIDPLMKSALFKQNSILIITFDESETWSSSTGNGWKVPWIVLGPRAKVGYRSSAAYNHASTLRFGLEALGLTGFPGQAASAPSMKEFLTP